MCSLKTLELIIMLILRSIPKILLQIYFGTDVKQFRNMIVYLPALMSKPISRKIGFQYYIWI